MIGGATLGNVNQTRSVKKKTEKKSQDDLSCVKKAFTFVFRVHLVAFLPDRA